MHDVNAIERMLRAMGFTPARSHSTHRTWVHSTTGRSVTFAFRPGSRYPDGVLNNIRKQAEKAAESTTGASA